MAWVYKREESSFGEVPEGNHRVRILNAEKAISKNSGNDMLVLELEVSGYTNRMWNYIAFLPDRPEITNRMLTQMFDCFGIDDGNFNLASYIGKAGAAKVKHDEQGRAKVQYFIKKGSNTEQDLPPFKSLRDDTGGAPTPTGEWQPAGGVLDDLF